MKYRCGRKNSIDERKVNEADIEIYFTFAYQIAIDIMSFYRYYMNLGESW